MQDASEQQRDSRTATEQLEELIMGLEHDQLVSARRGPLPPAHLSRGSRAALWALRIFVLVVGAMVIYTFCAQL